MRRSFLLAAVPSLFILGCQSSNTTEGSKPDAEKGDGIKIRAPGVNVDIDRGDKKKVDVEVHPNR